MTSDLRSGVIVEIALSAGVEVKNANRKCPIRCPLHDDRTASAFLDPVTNVFFCAVCTPSGGWGAKRFAEAIGVPWPPANAFLDATTPLRTTAPKCEFTQAMAARLWTLALDRARDDDRAGDDLPVYNYLRSRGLAETWEDRNFGILSSGIALPTAMKSWLASGHRLVGALYDQAGQLANVQSRSITGSSPKTLFPAGSKASGTLFASPGGIEVLRGSWSGSRRVLFGEGLTDFLALASVSPVPVLSAPGTSMAASGIGPWVNGYELILALDCDTAGDAVVSATARAAFIHGASRVHRVTWPAPCKDACDVVERSELAGLWSFLKRNLGEVGDARSAA